MQQDTTKAETVWEAPEVMDLAQVLAYELQLAANQNIDLDATDITQLASKPYDPSQPDRRGAALTSAVNEFRLAILNAGRIPVSKFEGSLPPEVIRTCLQHAAYNLLASTVNLKSVIVTENGVYTPFNKLQQEAQQMLGRLRAGAVVSYPTAVQAPPIDLTGGSGDIVGNYDMTWDGNISAPVTQ